MALTARVGVVVPAESIDPVADVRRLESLGFEHAALIGASPATVLLALGGTRSLRLLIDPSTTSGDSATSDVRGLISELDRFAPGYRDRLQWEAHDQPRLALDRTALDDPAEVRAAIGRQLTTARGNTVTVELSGGGHHDLVRILALEVLTDGLPGRLGPVRHAADLQVGDVFELGEHTLSEDDIVSFAERWDPLDFHIDPALARASPLGVLCASGVQTQAVMQRLAARGLHRNVAVVAGRGMLGMRLSQPVLPGMTLTGRAEITDVRPRPGGRAIVTTRHTLTHQGTPVLELTGELVVEQRCQPDQGSGARADTAGAPAGTDPSPDDAAAAEPQPAT
jgi:acyl dehydratase